MFSTVVSLAVATEYQSRLLPGIAVGQFGVSSEMKVQPNSNDLTVSVEEFLTVIVKSKSSQFWSADKDVQAYWGLHEVEWRRFAYAAQFRRRRFLLGAPCQQH